MLFFRKLKSEEYLELLSLCKKLKLEIESLNLDLQLYAKKLKASKGLKNEEREEDEKYKNNVLLPE